MNVFERAKNSPAARAATALSVMLVCFGALAHERLMPTRDSQLPTPVGPTHADTAMREMERANSLTDDAIGFEMNGSKAIFAHQVDSRDLGEIAEQAKQECNGPSTATEQNGEILVRCGAEQKRGELEQALRHEAGKDTLIARTDDGQTRVLTFDSKDPMDVRSMFPEQGDAPGSDSNTMPRPDKAVRIFSGVIQNTGSAVRIYKTDVPEEMAEKDMTAKMAKRGWQGVAGAEKGTLLYLNGAHAAVVRILQQESPGKGSLVTLMEIGTELNHGQ